MQQKLTVPRGTSFQFLVTLADPLGEDKTLEEGDTLTDVARMFYSPAYYGSFQDAVKEVKELNNLKNDHITEGCYLIIPVFID